MDWKSVKVPAGSRIFCNHKFTYLHGGHTYVIDIDEQSNGGFSGHAEHSTDSSGIIPSVSGNSIAECLQAVVNKIKEKYG